MYLRPRRASGYVDLLVIEGRHRCSLLGHAILGTLCETSQLGE
jgi:hypothetical protein